MSRRNAWCRWSFFLSLAALLIVGAGRVGTAADPSGAAQYPRWRGPDGSGYSPEKGVPVAWDASSVAWKTPLPGQGQSTPVIWGDRLFLTAAMEKGKERIVLCVDRRDGKILWQQVAWSGAPEESHSMNGWATPTCATDGAHVFASFGKAGLHCYTVEGQHVWSKQLGEFTSKSRRGTASSVVLVDDLVVWNGDSESDPWLFGLSKKTGEVVWKTPRSGREGYSTPIVVEASGRKELVLNGDPMLVAYEPATGKELWKCKMFSGRGEPTPAIGKELLYVVNGQGGDVFSIRPGGSGDVTKTHMAWHTPRKAGRDQPSPILIGNYLLVSSISGILCCYDATSGKELWKERLDVGADMKGSPFAAEDRAYFIGENGRVLVVQAGPEFKLLATNSVGPADTEVFRASLTPFQGRIYVRSDRVLYCVGK